VQFSYCPPTRLYALYVARDLGNLCESLRSSFVAWAIDATGGTPVKFGGACDDLVAEAACVVTELWSDMLAANLDSDRHIVNWLRKRVRNRLKAFVHNELGAGIVPWETVRKRRQRKQPGYLSNDPVEFFQIDKLYGPASQSDEEGHRHGIDGRWIESRRGVPWGLIYELAEKTLEVAERHAELSKICMAIKYGATIRSAARATGHREATIRGWLERLREDVLDEVPQEVEDAALKYFGKKKRNRPRKTVIVPNRNHREGVSRRSDAA
jgi:hypothetical protein